MLQTIHKKNICEFHRIKLKFSYAPQACVTPKRRLSLDPLTLKCSLRNPSFPARNNRLLPLFRSGETDNLPFVCAVDK